jgi:SAM-dependent methyltransferase
MLPFLGRAARDVVGYDVDLTAVTLMARYVEFPSNVEFRMGPADRAPLFERGEFDLILALDVLEHVADLEGTIQTLLNSLSPGGKMIVSGPTENWIYRLGRRFAGREFSGDYHRRGIGVVREHLSRLATPGRVADITRPWWLGLFFAVFVITKNPDVQIW